MEDSETVLSPLTSGPEVDFVREIDCGRLVEGWRKGMKIDITAELEGVASIRLYRCRRSQLSFFRPGSAAGSGKLYEDLSRLSWCYPDRKWEHEFALQLLGEKGGRLLEIGCGPGNFLAHAEKQGWEARGLELNEDAAAKARAKGFAVEVKFLEDFAGKSGEPFDAVCAFQVLEHLAEPLPFLEAAVEILKPGGLLVLCVPDEAGWVTRQWNLLDLPPHHMSRWNGAAFQFLTRILPLEMENLVVEPLQEYQVRTSCEANLLPWPGSESLSPLRKRLLKKLAKWAARLIRQGGLQRDLPGQSLMAVFRKRGAADASVKPV